MRRIIAAATFALVLGVAGASDPTEPATEGKAYVGFSFGGQKVAPRDFHYGLRVDPDSRFVDGLQAPLMQVDFTQRGLNDARVNGLSVLKRQYRLRQADEEAAAEGGETAAGEEPGFFSRTWSGVKNFFGGLFGGDEEEAAEEPAAETADAGAEAAPEEIAEGMFMGFNAVDWALLAAGAASVGAVAVEVSGGDEDPDPTADGGGGDGGEPCVPGPPPLCNPLFTGGHGWTLKNGNITDPEYQQWLDGGTGHMGDLGG